MLYEHGLLRFSLDELVRVKPVFHAAFSKMFILCIPLSQAYETLSLIPDQKCYVLIFVM